MWEKDKIRIQELDPNTGSRRQKQTFGRNARIKQTGACDLDIPIAFRIMPITVSCKYGNKHLSSTLNEKRLEQVYDISQVRKNSAQRNELTLPTGQEIFVLFKTSPPGLGTVHLPIQWVKVKIKVKVGGQGGV